MNFDAVAPAILRVSIVVEEKEMTAKATANPKGSASAAQNAKPDCCEQKTGVDIQTSVAKESDRHHVEQKMPAKAAKSSCCCDNGGHQPTT
jgi:hypothetical protein